MLRTKRLERLMFGYCLAALLVTLAPGCREDGNAGGSTGGTSDRLKIVTTTGMVTDMVEQIVANDADVEGLLQVGVDPHLYSPTAADVRALAEADVIVYSGLHLEAQMEDAIHQEDKTVIAVTDGLDSDQLLHPDGTDAHPDPHVWNDLKLWIACVEHTAEQLGKADPDHAASYAQRAAEYVAELEELDEYVRQVISSIPEDQRFLVTAHDAFSYFERAYEIPVRAVQGITTTSEPATSDINDLVQFLIENRVPAVFVETSVTQRGLDAVREGAEAQGWEVSTGAALYSDSMGPPGTYVGTFIGMIDHNATRIAQQLGGEAPEKGFQGKLE